MLLLLLRRFSCVRLCATPQTAAHRAPPSLGFSRQEHWSGLPFPSPMHESEKWKWSRLVMSNSSWPYGLQPTRLLHPWDFPGKSTGVGCHCLLLSMTRYILIKVFFFLIKPVEEHDHFCNFCVQRLFLWIIRTVLEIRNHVQKKHEHPFYKNLLFLNGEHGLVQAMA